MHWLEAVYGLELYGLGLLFADQADCSAEGIRIVVLVRGRCANVPGERRPFIKFGFTGRGADDVHSLAEREEVVPG